MLSIWASTTSESSAALNPKGAQSKNATFISPLRS